MKTVSSKNGFFSIGVIFCFLTLSVFIPVIETQSSLESENQKTSNPYQSEEWMDGILTGQWQNQQQEHGIIKGTMTLARTDRQGLISVSIFTEINEKIAIIKGCFYQSLAFGWIQTNADETQLIFWGTIDITDTTFDLFIRSSQYKGLSISGSHHSSFLPPLTGKYDIGVASAHLIDESRQELFTENTDDKREMMIQLWYPSKKNASADSYEYMDPATFHWLKTQSPIPLITIPSDAYRFVNPHAKQQAQIVSDEDSFPVIIFSHGYDGVYQIYTSFIEDLVSHGYVVVSINHPYVAGITVFPDGRCIDIATVPNDNIDDFFEMSLRTIVEDAKFVLDYITQLNKSEGKWQGRFDLSKVGIYGHSFGGAATSVCCLEDDRFDAGLTLDGVFYENFIDGPLSTPFLMMFTRNRFIDDEGADIMWDQLDHDAYRIGINGSAHYSYTDVGLLLQHLTPLLPPNLLGFGTIPPKRMVNISRTIERAFFDVYLGNDELKTLNTILTHYPEVSVIKKQWTKQ